MIRFHTNGAAFEEELFVGDKSSPALLVEVATHIDADDSPFRAYLSEPGYREIDLCRVEFWEIDWASLAPAILTHLQNAMRAKKRTQIEETRFRAQEEARRALKTPAGKLQLALKDWIGSKNAKP